MEGGPVLTRLGIPGDNLNWLRRPIEVPLPDQAVIGGAVRPLTWRFRKQLVRQAHRRLDIVVHRWRVRIAVPAVLPGYARRWAGASMGGDREPLRWFSDCCGAALPGTHVACPRRAGFVVVGQSRRQRCEPARGHVHRTHYREHDQIATLGAGRSQPHPVDGRANWNGARALHRMGIFRRRAPPGRRRARRQNTGSELCVGRKATAHTSGPNAAASARVLRMLPRRRSTTAVTPCTISTWRSCARRCRRARPIRC